MTLEGQGSAGLKVESKLMVHTFSGSLDKQSGYTGSRHNQLCLSKLLALKATMLLNLNGNNVSESVVMSLKV